MAAFARFAQCHAKPNDTNVAARFERGWIHKLSDNVVQSFVAEAAKGIDVFRVFDSLNWVENMRVAMDAVVEANKICEGTICSRAIF